MNSVPSTWRSHVPSTTAPSIVRQSAFRLTRLLTTMLLLLPRALPRPADITQLLEPPIPDKFVALVTADTCTSLSHPTEDVALAPAVTNAAPASVIEYVASATPETVNAYVAPAPVIEHIAPSPAVSYSSFFPSFSQPNEAITSLVKPQISIIADEASQVVGLFPLLEDNQVHQEEQIVTAVQPPVIVQETHQLPIVEWIQIQAETSEVVPQERVTQRTSEQIEVQMNTSSSSTSEQTVDIPIPRGV